VVVHYTFATPIAVATWPLAEAYGQVALERIRAEEESARGDPRPRGQEPPSVSALSSRAMKRETRDVLHQTPELRPLFAWSLEVLRELLVQLRGAREEETPVIRNAWASVYRQGDYHAPHSHPRVAFAGVYCVARPEVAPPEGGLTFLDPRVGGDSFRPDLSTEGESRNIDLTPGQLVVFPGWLVHFVHPHRHPSDVRVTISMNFELMEL
jgi:hypothetical protein